QENITFTADIKKPLSLGCQRGMLRKLMRPFDRAHHIKRESRPWDSGNIQRLSENLEVLDSRFHGKDEELRESRPLESGNIQRLAEALEVLDSRFHGNDERWRESKPLGNSNIQRLSESLRF
ncbi:hypothetical protein HHB49_04230, partial [Neisseria meningitidis]|nr:hypothetical protein [Neisseria meningitidis]